MLSLASRRCWWPSQAKQKALVSQGCGSAGSWPPWPSPVVVYPSTWAENACGGPRARPSRPVPGQVEMCLFFSQFKFSRLERETTSECACGVCVRERKHGFLIFLCSPSLYTLQFPWGNSLCIFVTWGWSAAGDCRSAFRPRRWGRNEFRRQTRTTTSRPRARSVHGNNICIY